jgi:hypothetical protein
MFRDDFQTDSQRRLPRAGVGGGRQGPRFRTVADAVTVTLPAGTPLAGDQRDFVLPGGTDPNGVVPYADSVDAFMRTA